jgi:hypothetical protein
MTAGVPTHDLGDIFVAIAPAPGILAGIPETHVHQRVGTSRSPDPAFERMIETADNGRATASWNAAGDPKADKVALRAMGEGVGASCEQHMRCLPTRMITRALRSCYAPPTTVTRAMLRARVLSALAASAIALAGCDSASEPSSAASADTQAVKYADCMRASGVPNFPDPGSNDALPNPASPAFKAAKEACAKLQPPGLHLSGPPEPSAAELRVALAFARCMRKHGFSHFPDPLTTLSDVTTLTLGSGEYFPDPGPTEVQSPAFRQAAKACGVQLPASPPP